MRLHQLLENREPLNEGKTVAVKFYDEFDTGYVVHIGDNTLSLNGAEVNKNFQWDRPKGHAFSTAESYVSEWMYKMAKSWDDVHAYLKRARDTGNEQTLLTAVQKTFKTASMQPKIVEGSYEKDDIDESGSQFDGHDIMSEDPPNGIDFDYANLSKVNWAQYSEEDIKTFYSIVDNLSFESGYYNDGEFDGSHDKALQWLEKNVMNKTEAQFDEAAGEKDACYHKVKSRYKVWPSAYASGALVKCRKVGAKNWGNSKK